MIAIEIAKSQLFRARDETVRRIMALGPGGYRTPVVANRAGGDGVSGPPLGWRGDRGCPGPVYSGQPFAAPRGVFMRER